jgi:hypothetical protein
VGFRRRDCVLRGELVARAELATLEASIFRAVNDLPQGLYTVVRPFMQYGTFITIFTTHVGIPSIARGRRSAAPRPARMALVVNRSAR